MSLFGLCMFLHEIEWTRVNQGLGYGLTVFTMIVAIWAIYSQLRKSLSEGTYRVALFEPILNISLGIVGYIQVRYMYLTAVHNETSVFFVYCLAFYITAVLAAIVVWQSIIIWHWWRGVKTER